MKNKRKCNCRLCEKELAQGEGEFWPYHFPDGRNGRYLCDDCLFIMEIHQELNQDLEIIMLEIREWIAASLPGVPVLLSEEYLDQRQVAQYRVKDIIVRSGWLASHVARAMLAEIEMRKFRPESYEEVIVFTRRVQATLLERIGKTMIVPLVF